MTGCWMGFLLTTILAFLGSCLANTVDYDSKAIIINGERKLILSGSIHYPRSTPEMWPDLIQKSKEGGLDAIESYIFWNAHEPRRRHYNFKGRLDFIKFFQKVQEAGMYGILRIGPYVCAEWNYGGFPVWLHNIPGIKMRTDNEIFKKEMQTFTTKIVDMVKGAKLFASQGGPIIFAQIENEYGNVMWAYGDAGKVYIKWCAEMAEAQNIGVPWIMCQQSNAPPPMINTCNGFYCDQFEPNSPKSPKMWTENWSGWYTKWGQKKPHRTAEDLAFAVARFFQHKGVLQNYYMYHGGTNFGRTPGGPFITTSYDYDAPLDQYGNLNQPKWGHLKNLHAAIKSGEKILTNYSNVTTEKLMNGSVELTTYTNNATGERFCFLSNVNVTDYEIDLKQDGNYTLPAWSVSVLQNCSKEIFNSAKVNAQTSVMVKELHKKDKPKKLSWSSQPEEIKDTLEGHGKFGAHQLIEQKAASYDESDYLWYMTRFDHNEKTRKKMTLRVKFSGQVLHAYVNGELIGSQWDYSFTFEKPVTLKPGKNQITLLSVTAGLQNYGTFFDEGTEGIAGGPVQLIDDKNTTIDLSSYDWSYKIGLHGEINHFYSPNAHHSKWNPLHALEKKQTGMIWYKTTFTTPSGTDPVVVDMDGMGKGVAWVNGKSLGRFWPSQKSDPNGCDTPCDYRGTYNNNKCLWNCGKPTQRWYHVPRSFLKKGENTLILFEEMGGNPTHVAIKIVTAKTICGNAYEGSTLEMSCTGGRVISDVKFASYGNPQGSCGSFKKGNFSAASSGVVVKRLCSGKESCSIPVSSTTFGLKDSGAGTNRLAVQAACHENKMNNDEGETDGEEQEEEDNEDEDAFKY